MTSPYLCHVMSSSFVLQSKLTISTQKSCCKAAKENKLGLYSELLVLHSVFEGTLYRAVFTSLNKA